MKKICLILFVLISFPLYVNANVIPANEEGIIIVPRTQSADLKEHQLISISNEAASLVQSDSGVTTFSTFDYRDGYFDHTPPDKYTVNKGSVIDNNPNDSIGTITVNPDRGGFRAIFSEPININGFYIRSSNNNSPRINFYSAGEIISTFDTISNVEYYEHKVKNVDRIDIFSRASTPYLREFEIFVDLDIDYIATSNIKVYDIKETTANVSFTAPESKHYKESQILVDGVSFYRGTDTDILLENLKSNTNYELVIRSYYSDGNFVDTKTTFQTAKDTIPPGDVMNLTAKEVGKTVVLNWAKPSDKDFSHVRITRNGMFVADKIKDVVYTDESPKLNAENVYRVFAIDESGNFSDGASVTVNMIGKEVYNVQAKAVNHGKVDLKWENPQHKEFETVRIARKVKNSGMMAKFMSLFSGDGYTDLFQTNGTIFNDLTVSADTQYTYKISTVIDGSESPGVTVDVKTPKLTASGGGVEVSPDDPDTYVISWSSPTTGKMKILIGGKEYKIVPAQDKKILVPKADMKFDLIGKPDVKLIPIDDDGKEGEPTSPGGGASGGGLGEIVGGGTVNGIVNAPNLLKAGVSLLIVVGGFFLLGLAFKLVPKLVKVIKVAFEAKRERGNVGRRID